MDQALKAKLEKHPDREYRAAAAVEVRAANDKMVVEGYALTFDNPTLIGSKEYGWYEVIRKGCFEKTDMKEVPLRYNHDSGYLALASTYNGSLKLTIDDVGLRYEADLLNISEHKSVYEMIKSGLLCEMSFAMSGIDSRWGFPEGDIPLREIVGIDRLYDVSLVDVPAYEGTEAHVRSFEALEDARKAAEAEKGKRNGTEIERQKLELKIRIGLGGSQQ